MRYQLKQIHCRPWTLGGMSLKLIESHYENNYGGALRRLNAITEQLEKLDFATAPGYLINSLKREELVALNSTLLHELYFASMGGEGRVTEAMSEVLARDFGSAQKWRAEFTAMGYALGGGPGWVLLTWMPRDGRLINQYAAEHTQAVPGGSELLAQGKVQLIDTRPKHYYSRQNEIAEGVEWRDPERVREWMGELDKAKPVIVYCAYGFHVGCRTAIALRDAGFDAKYMNVGHSGWKAVGALMRIYG